MFKQCFELRATIKSKLLGSWIAALGDMLRTFELEERDLDPKDPWSGFLSSAAFAIRSTFHTTLEATPAQLVYGRDMILPVQFKADWDAIKKRRQKTINQNNERENRSRIDHTYKVGDSVSKHRHGILPKLRRRKDGPYVVQKVYANGTVSIRKGAVTERVNIRHITPFHERRCDQSWSGSHAHCFD